MKTVIGENSDAQYQIKKELGRGAQGRVFSIKGDKYALKLIGKKSSKNAQLLKRKISYIKTRNISDLNISKPIEQIRGDYLGYIMEMATDMMPLEDLLKPKNELEWWAETGGLKKRLEILKNLAKLLSDLHGRGLIYGDLSPSNIFVSTNRGFSEVYLIDVDNITHESKVGDAFYTPGYGAPEVVKGISGADTYTDDYSFSVIAYQLLTLNHPFIGDYVSKGVPELEEDASLGKIPWIEHSLNDINKATTGLTSSLVISKKMMLAFHNTFEMNHLNKLKRTSSSKWYEILKISLNALLECDHCNNAFFYSSNLRCSFCNMEKEEIGVIKIHPLNVNIKNELKEDYLLPLDEIKNVGKSILTKLCSLGKYIAITEDDLFLNESDDVLFEIKCVKDANFIRGISKKDITVYTKGEIKEGVNIGEETQISLGNWLIFSKDLQDSYQRVIKVGRKRK